jgi:uncharacterized protein
LMHEPSALYFKPMGIPMFSLEQVQLAFDELEAIRLNDWEDLGQTASARKMQISQPTFNRILGSARKKVANALVNGKALKIEGGTYRLGLQETQQIEPENYKRCCESDGTEAKTRLTETQKEEDNP